MSDTTGVGASMQASADLSGALQDLLRQLVDKILGGPSHDKDGRPLQDVCYMQMVQGDPIDPRDFSFPWDPSGLDSSADFQDDGKQGTASLQNAATPSGAAASGDDQASATVTAKMLHALASARKTAVKFDQMLRVTDDGTYRPFTSAGTLSSSYEAIITKAQGIPAPPLPPDIQKRVDAALHVIHVFDDQGNMKGFTKEYKAYWQLKQAYTDAEGAFANAYAAAMANATLGQVWPVTSKSFKTAVDNAYDDWRSSDADKMENALETVQSVGGSIGAHFVAQARALFDAWTLPEGAVAVSTPYTEIMPGSWYDPNDTENGFTKITASHSQFQLHGQSSSSRVASDWYNGHASSTGGSAGGVLFGVAFGGGASHSEDDHHSGSHSSGEQNFSFGNTMSNCTIKLEYGLCTIYRPWLLRELFTIDGWYLPGEKDKVVSDGTIGGQKGGDDKHLLPMIPTRFLVLRNISIEANGWGRAGTEMSKYCTDAQHDDGSSSTNVRGAVGFMGFGGSVSHQSADWSGDDAQSASAAGSWFFSGDDKHGVLTINGCQIVGYIGEIVPASPKIDGTKPVAAAPQPGATQTTSTAQTGAAAQPAPVPAH